MLFVYSENHNAFHLTKIRTDFAVSSNNDYFQLNERNVRLLFKMEGTCNECVFPLNKEESEGVCATDTSLTYTASKGKLSCVKELIVAGVDVNSVCECYGNGALLSAAMEGRVDCFHELIISGTQVNIQNNKGNTTLMMWILCACFRVRVQKLFLSSRPLPVRRSAVAF